MFSSAINKVDTQQFQRLLVVRAIGIACECLAVITAMNLFNLKLPVTPILVIIGLQFLFNILAWWRIKKIPTHPTDREFFSHLGVDVLSLTALLYFSGGPTNPFVSLFLLPIIIIAATLPTRFAAAMALLSVVCYTLLMFFYVPLPHHHVGHGTEFDLHVFGMWLSFVLAVVIIIFFVLIMTESLRERDNKLVQIREQALRDDSLVALGTFAAGAAHDLGTPLATMSLTVEDLLCEYDSDPDLQQQLLVLQSQIQRCKITLTELSARSGQIRAEGGYRLPLDQYLEKIVTEWKNIRPDTSLDYTWEPTQDEEVPFIIGDQTLRQAISNILNNAADACNKGVEMKAKYRDQRLMLEVLDDGSGLPEDFSLTTEPLNSTKHDGPGMGIFLSEAVIKRLGGNLLLNNLPQGGTQAHIDLPLDKLDPRFG
ncbi:MAG: ATP-binding protein [Gammaproteobacteria bacterium]|nr:ATP-binding protein [Gammaproteobacteria bacterium]MDH5799976.1 ATP-binding protein [Gammaproteobacteria bacterium]